MTPTLLYVGMKYDYGDRRRGLSFEHRNFHESLRTYCERQGWQFSHYDFMARGQAVGQDAMTQELYDHAAALGPTVLFSVLFNPQHDPRYDVFDFIGNDVGALTLHWFCDDHWRFEDYTQHVAPHFQFSCTTAQSALPRYAAIGLADRVIKTQWACNHELYAPMSALKDVPISFVGMPHGDRPQVLTRLAQMGLNVDVFGHGWQGRPRLPFHQMVRMFSRSKINLNLSNASVDAGTQQIKGRNFEVPGAGGFLLTGDADNLSDYYTDGKEIVVYRTEEELLDKAIYYLTHDAEREQIARAGYERTLREHTWHGRFDAVLREAGARLAAQAGQRAA